MKMKTLILLLLMVSVCFVPAELCAKFYKYIDKDGNIRFVDEISKIPPQYMNQIKEYKEKYDHLSEQEKSEARKRDREEEELRQKKRLAEKQKLEEQKRSEEERREKTDREKYLKSLETKVVVNGNQILVPVKLGYKGNELETFLLLDTGSSDVVLNQEIADRLGVKPLKKGWAQVAGGKLIETNSAKLNYVRIGPLNMPDTYITIIQHKGPAVEFSGYLGMRFLRNIKYTVDYQNQVIRWQPELSGQDKQGE